MLVLVSGRSRGRAASLAPRPPDVRSAISSNTRLRLEVRMLVSGTGLAHRAESLRDRWLLYMLPGHRGSER